MTRHTSAARDLAALLATASPDVAAANAAQVAALDAETRAAAGKVQAAQPSEHDEQCALFAWAAAMEGAHPELACMFAVPNGGARHPAVAAQLKAEGVRDGAPDIFLPVMRRGVDGRTWGGLFVELKRADHSNGPTPEQRVWIERLRSYGYRALVCYGADEAIAAILAYLTQEE